MKVVLADEARRDLERIADYIAKDNPSRARSFVAELRDKAREIGAAPEAFQLVSRHARSGVRRRVYRSYLIFYRIEADQVSVIHILHGAQDYEALLFPDEDPRP